MALSDYFNVVSAKDQVLHIRLEGFWSDESVKGFEAEFLKTFQKGVDSLASGGKPFFVVADMSAFQPPSTSATTAIGKCMKYAKEAGLMRTVEVMSSAMSRLAVKNAAKQTGKDDFRVVVNTLDEAWAEIDKLKELA